MSITGKELAKQLGLSTAAVSMALTGKPGVSPKTRQKVINAARAAGYDFTKNTIRNYKNGTIYFIIYRKHGVVVTNINFYNQITDGLREACKEIGCHLSILEISYQDPIRYKLETGIKNDCIGIIILGTEMKEDDDIPIEFLPYPIVVMDTFFHSNKVDFVMVNNEEGAYLAVHHLLYKTNSRPGYIHSSYPTCNYSRRSNGFFHGLHANGQSTINVILHEVPPNVDGAYSEMLNIIDSGSRLARCYFADDDYIAIGAMKAFRDRGFRIPEDIAIIGFNNITMCDYVEPKLSSINVPAKYYAGMALQRLLSVIENKEKVFYPVCIYVNTEVIPRESV